MEPTKKVEAFENGSTGKIVFKNALPAMAAMLMALVYNLADTFFIGQTHNDYMVAAVSIVTPVFLIFMSFGNIFGVGGVSVISRAMGEGRRDYARKVCSFCMWGSVAVGLVLMICFWVFMDEILALLGAGPEIFGYTKDYMNTVVICGVFSMISTCYSMVIRAEGKSTVAMAGTIIGNILNVILDPILIFVFDLGIVGAALATVIGNAVATIIYVGYFLSGKSVLSISPKDFSMRDGIFKNVFAVGIPASLGSLLVSLSQMVIMSRVSNYGDMEIAAYGVSGKIMMISSTISLGVGQGVQPILGYFYGARNKEKFMAFLRYGVIFSLITSSVLTAFCYLFTPQIVRIFLTDQSAIGFAVRFSRLILCAAWLCGAFYALINALQAIGAARSSLLISVSRQGIIYIPAAFLMEALIGCEGLTTAQPIADVLSLILAIFLVAHELKKRKDAFD